ncbi:MAG: hypothetical protein V2I66_07430 [Halieaceae bacterium]|nr:hypothetical protein [Halieaceae bacterium]
MNSKEHETEPGSSTEALEALARSSLDESVAHLDAATLSRLNRARQQALAEVNKPYNPGNWLALAAGAFAIIAIAVALPLLPPGDSAAEQDPGTFSVAEDAALMEDLDLVLWMMESEDHAS